MVKVSIIIPSFNQGAYLEDTLRSVIAQSHREWELIVIDGGSTDQSVDIIRRYESHLAYWQSCPDRGQSDAINQGLRRATGELVTWLSSDDILLPDALAEAVRYAERYPDVQWFLGNVLWMDSESRVIRIGRVEADCWFWNRRHLFSNGGPAAFMRRELLLSMGGVREDFHYMMDTELWHRYVAGGHRFVRLPHYCWGLRLHEAAKMSGHHFGNSELAQSSHPSWRQKQWESATLSTLYPESSLWRRCWSLCRLFGPVLLSRLTDRGLMGKRLVDGSMQGLIVWPNSYCRSTLAFYRSLAEAWGVPLELYLFNRDFEERRRVGFSDQEFSDLTLHYLSTLDEGRAVVDAHPGWHHLFGVYQVPGPLQTVLLYAHAAGCRVAIASEAPCNMHPYPSRLLKQLYLRFLLPRRVRPYVEASDFVINYSGDDLRPMLRNGWRAAQVIPCGYYSPPLVGSRLVPRTEEHWQRFTILSTGLPQWHRSPMLLIRALHLLRQRRVRFRCLITQSGDATSQLQRAVSRWGLTDAVQFLGFVPLPQLIELYETCSLFVATGDHEPWGMRLNDALQCGAPLVVNRGMGGRKLVDDYHCGLTFAQGSASSLADALQQLITDRELYLRCAAQAVTAAARIAPQPMAACIAHEVSHRFPSWTSSAPLSQP